ncbi:hypothetical protein [Defluviimonas salinarum]|uniref:Uncharacterized protein n=1 Tax=Defluviimonas salinarum TaxID=2992147 RepID=A0ABT3J361_9RHOB|nr:hypothetical protein [Defluviimonas salinarum]MCW3782135.1 hypothetical protein [Defluviimonas salinarum]
MPNAQYQWVLTLATLIGGAGVARSECATDDYDQTPPRKISGDVTNAGMQFEWASDFDQKNGINYVWHYIKNAPGSEPLNFNWKKAGLRQEFVRPLPPGDTACTQYPVVDLNDNDIDDDAPIIYGHANRVQRAAIYAKETTTTASAKNYQSKLSSSYVDDFGEKRDFEVSFVYESDGETISKLEIIAPEDLYVGIANVESYWSNTTIENIFEAAKMQKMDFDFAALPSFASDRESTKAFFIDLENREALALIIRGTVQSSKAGKISGSPGFSEMVIFDQDRNPIASTFVALPVTKADLQ